MPWKTPCCWRSRTMSARVVCWSTRREASSARISEERMLQPKRRSEVSGAGEDAGVVSSVSGAAPGGGWGGEGAGGVGLLAACDSNPRGGRGGGREGGGGGEGRGR